MDKGLFKEKQFRGRYKPRDGDMAEYEFHPLGLVFRDAVVYLVATVWDYQDPRHWALHRFLQCKLLIESRRQPEGFDLDDYVRNGSFEYTEPQGTEIKLVALFTDGAALHLRETPLSGNQDIEKDRDGWVKVTATVKDSQQLRWWLLGFGEGVEVVAPSDMRDAFAHTAKVMVKLYR